MMSILGLVGADSSATEATGVLGGNGLNFALGTAFNSRTDNTAPASGLAWAFSEAEYRSPRWQGLQLGASALATSVLWEPSAGIGDAVFTTPVDLRALYLSLSHPGGRAQLDLGRKAFASNPVVDGESQQGAALSIDLSGSSRLRLMALNRWIKHSTPDYDAWGITGWRNAAKANPRAGDVFLGFGLYDLHIGEHLSVSPFVSYQENVLAVYGSTFKLSCALGGSDNRWQWHSETILAYYENQVPVALQPDYEDVRAARLHTSLQAPERALGIGLYWLSDDRNDIGAGLFSDLDPLQEDDLYPYNDENHVTLVYATGRMDLDELRLRSTIGIGRNAAVGADSVEIDLFFDYALNSQLTLSGYFVHVDFSAELPDYSTVGTSLSYNF